MIGRVAIRLAAIPATAFVVWAALAAITPIAMSQYSQYTPRAGVSCGPRVTLVFGLPTVVDSGCTGLADVYHLTFGELVVDATLRSLALLLGAAALALVVGTLLGIAIALQRHRAVAGGALMGATASQRGPDSSCASKASWKPSWST